MKTLKQKKCKADGCGALFTPARPLQKACSPLCAESIARKKAEAVERKSAAEERKKDREKREKLKTRSDWMKEARQEFNRYIRLRDYGRGCISCNKVLCSSSVGGGYDAGHYRSVGSAPHLRFVECNVHGQCKKCNRWGSGMSVDYRAGLILRIGLDQVEKLEADQEPRKYTTDDLKEIKLSYRAKANALQKQIDK